MNRIAKSVLLVAGAIVLYDLYYFIGFITGLMNYQLLAILLTSLTFGIIWLKGEIKNRKSG